MLNHSQRPSPAVCGIERRYWGAVDKRSRAADEIHLEEPEGREMGSIGDDVGKVGC